MQKLQRWPATFNFTHFSGLVFTDVTIYVPNDSNPEGAAGFLYKTLCKPSTGNFATQFLRANEQSYITDCHQVHKETNFLFDINTRHDQNLLTSTIKVLQRKKDDELSIDYEDVYYEGTVQGFIEREWELAKNRDELCTEFFTNAEETCLQYKPFVKVKGYEIMNEILADKIIQEKLKCLAPEIIQTEYYKKAITKIKNLIVTFPELLTPEISQVLGAE